MGKPSEDSRINCVIVKLSNSELATLDAVTDQMNVTKSDAVRMSLKALLRALQNGLLDVEAQRVGEEIRKLMAERKGEPAPSDNSQEP